MSKRVQFLRHALAEANLFVGLEGEVTINTSSSELRVHDGTTAGGSAAARADLTNVSAATAENDGKMTASQASALTTATADIAVNAAAIATNVTDIAARAVFTGTITAGHAVIGDGSKTLKTAGFILEQQIPTGTKALFCQAAAPNLWTKDTDVNDRVLRMVSGTGAGTGGSWTISGISVDGHALTKGEIPAHVHTDTAPFGFNQYSPGANNAVSGSFTTNTGDGTADGLGTGGGGAASTHTHTLTIGSAWRPSYVDVIKCTKDAPVSLA